MKLIRLFHRVIRKLDTIFYVKGPKIGQNTIVLTKNFGSEPYLVSIGNNCLITDGVRFITHDGSISVVKNIDEDLSLDEVYGKYNIFGKIVVGDNVFIGLNTIILPGVSIGDNVVVGAGSIITKNLESNSVYAGNPARKIMTIEEYSDKINQKDECVIESSIPHRRMDEIIKKTINNM